MESTGLFLKEDEVPVGAVVAICFEGKEVPEVDKSGEPFVLQVLMAGVPTRAQFFPADGSHGGLTLHKPAKVSREPAAITGTAMTGFLPNVRFMPAEVFTPKTAPRNTKFAVFVKGKRLFHERSERNVVVIYANPMGRLISVNGYEYGWYGREFPLPDDAVLVPITRVGHAGEHVARVAVAAPA